MSGGARRAAFYFLMYLLVVRHGIAEDRNEWSRAHGDDASRPLTKAGRRKMKDGAKGLRSLVPTLDVLATSPLTRALETAQILAAEWGRPDPVTVPALAPGQRPEALAAWLRTQAGKETVAVVGHDPGLSVAVSWLAAGVERPMLELGKGGACLLRLSERIDAGEALLLWLLRPAHLRELGH